MKKYEKFYTPSKEMVGISLNLILLIVLKLFVSMADIIIAVRLALLCNFISLWFKIMQFVF